MSLHDDLRVQAWHLARMEPRKPRQASLRRALSTAYYALFHLLVDAAAKQVLGAADAVQAARQVIARGYQHGQMASVCRSFSGGTLPRFVAEITGPLPVPADLQTVAETFVRLQERRHQADYALAERFIRGEVVLALRSVDQAFSAWRRIHRDPLARLMLALLTTHDSARRR